MSFRCCAALIFMAIPNFSVGGKYSSCDNTNFPRIWESNFTKAFDKFMEKQGWEARNLSYRCGQAELAYSLAANLPIEWHRTAFRYAYSTILKPNITSPARNAVKRWSKQPDNRLLQALRNADGYGCGIAENKNPSAKPNHHRKDLMLVCVIE